MAADFVEVVASGNPLSPFKTRSGRIGVGATPQGLQRFLP